VKTSKCKTVTGQLFGKSSIQVVRLELTIVDENYEFMYSSYFSSGEYFVYRGCLSAKESSIVNRCRQKSSDEGYFIDNERCCLHSDSVEVDKNLFNVTICHCDYNYCNVETPFEAASSTLQAVSPSLKTVGPSLQTVRQSLNTVGKSLSLTISIYALSYKIICLKVALETLTIFAV